MFLFWMVAAVISAVAAGLILVGARGQSGFAGSVENPELAVHRRHLQDLDGMVARGLLDEAEYAEARAEAGRRLIAAAEITEPVRDGGRWLAPTAAVAVPVLALVVYLVVGSPGVTDAPMASRVTDWRNSDARSLTAPQMAAVLTELRKERPRDAQLLSMLASARLASNDPYGAAKALREAVALRPNDPALWASLGEAFIATSGGEVGADARRAFAEALKLDPRAAVPRYHLARAYIVDGEVSRGLEGWRSLLADLPPQDERRDGLAQEIALVERTGGLAPAPDMAQAADGQPNIRAMVDGLAARLEAEPDDPDGWARLIRAYAVLGETEKQQAALEKARARFKSRPDIVRRLESASEAPQ
jgi:cytochrome c-type biogenesis protein CcmH